MDTIVFGLILAAAIIILRSPKRWLVVTSYFVAFAGTGYIFLHHATDTLDLNF